MDDLKQLPHPYTLNAPPDWADDAFLRMFDNLSRTSQLENWKHPKKAIMKRALEGYSMAVDICYKEYPLDQALIPMWMPYDSYRLMRCRMKSKNNDLALSHFLQRVFTWDYDLSTQLLTLHTIHPLARIATPNLLRSLHASTHPFCLTDGTGRTWRVFRPTAAPPRLPNGSDARLTAGTAFLGCTALRTPTHALWYRGPGQNERYPDFVVEVGTRDKCIGERAEWYFRATGGETRVVLGLVVGGEGEWEMRVWRCGGGDEDEGRWRVVDGEGRCGGVAVPLRDVIPPGAVEAIEGSDCGRTVAMLERRIEVTWEMVLEGFEMYVRNEEMLNEIWEESERELREKKGDTETVVVEASGAGSDEGNSDSDTDTDTDMDSD
ncbi:hypothetical protein SLS58_009195 [Diplodia intermedia]|uniref:Uncharacterized protein n=1 Tax=Diplodia intermedia TaxID=856260 RepID=A0ABR3TDS4_9PEZI